MILIKNYFEFLIGKDQTPLGQLPYLVVDDFKIPQSISMARFLARRFNLAGKDELEQLKSDVIMDTLCDLRNGFNQKVYSVEENERPGVIAKFIDDAKVHLNRIEKLINEYGGSSGFSVGSNVTWADFELYEVTSKMLSNYPNVLDSYRAILAVRNNVENHHVIGPYLKNRPVTSF